MEAVIKNMNKEEFDFLMKMEKDTNEIIRGEDLEPYTKDRTLLYGNTCEGEIFHVYIKDKFIHVVVYKEDFPYDFREVEVNSNHAYKTDGDLYLECCDFHFCQMLQARRIRNFFDDFTTREQIPVASSGYYGRVMGEIPD